MHRKRCDLEILHNENRDEGPTVKKVKTPTSRFDKTLMNDQNLVQPNGIKQADILDGILKPAQPTVSSFPNRKRRSRNVHELLYGQSSSATDANGQIRKKSDLSCVVCTDLAHGYNFDAISCESCKAFFRRNALFNMDRLKCRRDGNCEITPETRRRCKSCRLKKCFTVGMRKEWILTEEEKINKKRRIEENRRMRIISMEDGKLDLNKLSSAVACSSSGTNDLELQTVLLNKNEKPPLKRFDALEKRDVVSNVVNAFRDGFQLDPTSYGWSYPLARKITALCQILNTKNATALRLISFYKRLREFDSLNDIDKVNLVKGNLRYMFFFHGALGYDPNIDVYFEENSTNDKPVYGSDIREAYGAEIHVRCTSIMRELHSLSRLDKRFIQLALVIFLFSKGLSNLVNSNEQSLLNYKQVLDIQNMYVEQLWLLMLKVYGSSRAVVMFSSIVSKCLLIQNLLRDIQQDVHERLEQDEVSPIMRSVIQLT